MNEIPERLADVRQRIAAAALASGRQPDEVALLAVRKTKPVTALSAAYRAGQHLFGENHLQARNQAPSEVGLEWHFIGRIQSKEASNISRHFA